MSAMDNTSQNVIVLDNGSGLMKAGIAGEESPRVVHANVVGRPKFDTQMIGMGKKSVYVGDEAQNNKGILNISYPVSNGKVNNWEDMALIWEHTMLTQLRVEPHEHSVMLTEPPLNPASNKEKAGEIFFEMFNMLDFYSAVQATLSLYASGRTTGLVLDSGDGVSHTVPIYEGYTIQHAVNRLDVAGRAVTNYLVRLLGEAGLELKSHADTESVRELKEKYCRVSLDYDKEKEEIGETELFLSDGERFNVSHQIISAPECLFNPTLIGSDVGGIHTCITKSLFSSDRDLRRAFCSNIVLSGGTTTIPRFEDRLNQELTKAMNTDLTINIIAPAVRNFSVWIGGSVLGSLSSYRNVVVTKEEFKEHGKGIISKKIK